MDGLASGRRNYCRLRFSCLCVGIGVFLEAVVPAGAQPKRHLRNRLSLTGHARIRLAGGHDLVDSIFFRAIDVSRLLLSDRCNPLLWIYCILDLLVSDPSRS